MTYKVIILGRAERELKEAADYITQRAPEAAQRWFSGFIEAMLTLAENPDRCSLAPEDALFPYEVRQLFYKTKGKSRTRALFTIVGNEVRILMIRRPGQDLVREVELP